MSGSTTSRTMASMPRPSAPSARPSAPVAASSTTCCSSRSSRPRSWRSRASSSISSRCTRLRLRRKVGSIPPSISGVHDGSERIVKAGGKTCHSRRSTATGTPGGSRFPGMPAGSAAGASRGGALLATTPARGRAVGATRIGRPRLTAAPVPPAVPGLPPLLCVFRRSRPTGAIRRPDSPPGTTASSGRSCRCRRR